ncbi:MAG TPA: hypothetical protein PK765_06390 [bacterium]|nr:hypothetical protein [bacterium]
MPSEVTIENITSASREELVEGLAMLRQYRRMRRSIGKRAREIFSRARSGEIAIRGERAANCDASTLIVELDRRFPDLGLGSLADQIVWTENPHLEGGIRLFVGDEMIDASYRRIRTGLLS